MWFLRWLLFLALAGVSVSLFDWLLEIAIINIAKLAWYWMALLLIFGSAFIVSVVTIIPGLLMTLAAFTAPNKLAAGWIFSICCVAALVVDCIKYAQMDFSLFGMVVVYYNVLLLWGSLCFGALNAMSHQEDNSSVR